MTAAKQTKRTRLAQKRRKVRMLKMVAILCLGILAYAGLMYSLTQEWASIRSMSIRGNITIASDRLEVSIKTQMASLRAYSLYAGTILTYDEDAIASMLMYTYPQIKSVELSSSSIDVLDVDIVERRAVAQWCSETLQEGCYLVDDTGYIFKQVEEAEVGGLVIYKGAIVGDPLRRELLPGRYSTVSEFVELLHNADIEVTTVDIQGGELRVESRGVPILKVKLDDNLARTAGYASATIRSTDYKTHSNGTTTPEYIDLRFGNRVYYK